MLNHQVLKELELEKHSKPSTFDQIWPFFERIWVLDHLKLNG